MAIGGSVDKPIALKGILIDKTQGIYLMAVGELRQFVSIRVGETTIPIVDAISEGYLAYVGSAGQANYPGIAYVQITDPDKRKNDDGSYVQIAAEVVGLKLGTHTVEECRNGARFLYWLLKEPVEGGWGLGVPESEIDLDSFTEAISRVDAAGLKLDGVFYFRQPAQSWIDQICQAIRGTYEIGENGKRRLFVNANAFSVKTYTKKNIKLLRKGKSNYVGRVFNKGRLDFDFNPITGLFLQHANYQNSTSIGDIEEQPFTGQSYLIRDMATAQAILDYTCQKSQIGADKVYFETTELPEDARTGQIITFDYPEKSLTGTWQIIRLEIGKSVHKIDAEKFSSTIFTSGTPGTTIDWAYDPPIVSPVTPGQPSGLSLTPTIDTNPDGTCNVGISGTFTLPARGYIGASVLWGEGNPPPTWNDYGLIKNGQFQLNSLKPGTNYYVKVQMISSTGKSDFITGSITTQGDTVAPGSPTIAVAANLKNIAVSITLASRPNDLAGFRIYRNIINDALTAVPKATVENSKNSDKATVNLTADAYGDTYYFWATAYDKWGNESGFSTIAGPVTISSIVYSDISNQLLKMPMGSVLRLSANGCTSASIAEVDGVKDVSFNGNHGRAYGGVSVVDSEMGKAFRQSSTQYIQAPGDSLTATDRTFACWIKKRNSNQAFSQIFAQNTSANSGSGLGINGLWLRSNGSLVLYATDGLSVLSASGPAMNAGDFYRAVGVIRGGESLELYINGELFSSINTTLNPRVDGLNVFIGGYPSTSEFDCIDPRVYNRALTAAEVKSEYMLPQDAVFGQVIADFIGANAVRAKHMAIDEAVISVSAQIANAIINDAHVDSLSATKIRVGGRGAALNDDPNFEDAESWGAHPTYPTYYDSSIVSIPDGKVGNKAMRSDGYSIFAAKKLIPVDESKTYRLRAWLRRVGAESKLAYLAVECLTADGSSLGVRYAVSDYPTAAWTELSGIIGAATGSTFPTGAAFVRLYSLLNYQGTTSYQEMQDFRLEEVLPSVLIQDGAVTAEKLSIGSVKNIDTDAAVVSEIITNYSELSGLPTLGSVAALNSITNVYIQDGAVIASKVAAGAILADKLSVLASSLVNPVSQTKNVRGWGNNAEDGSTTSTQVVYNASQGALDVYHNANYGARSQTFLVDPNKIYRVQGRIAKSLAHGYWYLGVAGFSEKQSGYEGASSASGSLLFQAFNSSRVSTELSNNAYFHYQAATDTDYVDFTFFLIGANRSVTEAPNAKLNGGTPTMSPYIKCAASSPFWCAIRLLNWSNSTGVGLYAKDLSVSEVGSGEITADSVRTGKMVSTNHSATAGSYWDLDAGDLELGGSDNPTFSWTNSTGVGNIGKLGFETLTVNDVPISYLRLTELGNRTDSGHVCTKAYYGAISYFSYNGTQFVVSHGGISADGQKSVMPSIDMGVAKYGVLRKTIVQCNMFDQTTEGSHLSPIVVETGVSAAYAITTNGKIHAAGGFNPASDENKKSDVNEVNALEKLRKIRVRQYKLDDKKIAAIQREKEIEESLKTGNAVVAEHLIPPPEPDIEDYNPMLPLTSTSC
jgi:hypothetical protein